MEDPRARAAAALRHFGHALHAHDADDELLRRVARAAEQVTTEVEAAPPRQRDLEQLKAGIWSEPVADGELIDHFADCFVSGRWNPLGIGIEIHREGDEAVARLTLGPAYEGAPARSHGGIVAAIFDDVLGCLLRFEQRPAFTGELTVRYLAPTPIGEPLVFRARVTGLRGRKLDTEGEAWTEPVAGEPLQVAAATARFITIEDYLPDAGPA